MKAFPILLIILVFASCKKHEEKTPAPTNEMFELTAATDWTLVNLQGIDTYIGYYQKGNYKIHFDCGSVAFTDLGDIKNTPDLLYYEELVIDGNEAKIIKENQSNGVLLSAYIDKGDGINKNWLYTSNTSNDQIFMDIIKSHKFK